MNYRKTKKTLDTLTTILMDYECKRKDREVAGAFNKNTTLGNEFNLKKLNEEIQELELEFKRTSREL